MRATLLTATAAAALVLAAGPAALAQCEADALGVTCTGTDADGFASSEDGVSLQVVGGTSVSAPSDAIALTGQDAQLGNLGTIDGGADAIVLGAGGTVSNDGTVTAGDDGIDADGLDGIQVINNGSITGGTGEGNRGVVVGDGADAVLLNNGTIEAFDEGVEAGDDAEVTNAGLIQSNGEDGVQLARDGLIVNSGTIYGGLDNGDGIDIDSGEITNLAGGLIESRARGLTPTEDGAEAGIDVDEGDGEVTIFNQGTIRGEIGILEDGANTGGHEVYNEGAIVGTGGIAVNFAGEGDDLFALAEGGTVEGTVLLGEGDDDLVLEGIMDANVGGGAGALFDGGEGEDLIAFDLSVSLTDIVSVAMSAAFEEATELAFRNADGSESLIVFAGFELFDVQDRLYSLSELLGGDAIPLPGALVLFGSALGLGAATRRRRRA